MAQAESNGDEVRNQMGQLESEPHHDKVSVVGAGQVGMAIAFSILTRGVASDITLVNVDGARLKGEVMDLQHGLCFVKEAKIQGDSDYKVTAGSKVCIVSAGKRQKEGESRLNLTRKNAEILKGIIPNLVKYSPNAIFIIVTNPVDIMTYVAWKLSGLPDCRVIGSGTSLDTARFRFFIGEKLGIAPSSVHGYIIGEHGDSSVVAWSSTEVAGVSLKKMTPLIDCDKDKEEWTKLHNNNLPRSIAQRSNTCTPPEYKQWEGIHERVINSANEIIKLKGYTSWAIGLSVCTLTNAVLRNHNAVYAMSTLAKGHHGIHDDVFLSLPCVLGQNGIGRVLTQTLTEGEQAQLQNSAKTLRDILTDLKLTSLGVTDQ